MDFCDRIHFGVECLDLIAANYKDTLKPKMVKRLVTITGELQ
jgi:hypothetical protein